MNLDQWRVDHIDLVVKVPQPAGKTCVFENRRNYGLLFVEYGDLFYTSEGISYPSNRKSAVILPKGITYTLHCVEDSLTYVVNFDLFQYDNIDTIQCLRGFSTSAVLNQLNSMEHLWTLQPSSYIPKTLAMLYEIISKLSEFSKPSYLPQRKIQKISPSIEYMEQHFDDPGISNEMLAALSGVSTVYFRKLFSEIYNQSPMKYVYNLRMAKARAMLSSGYSSITETAGAVGFTNIYHFSRSFKQCTGLSPSHYMNQVLLSSQQENPKES